MPTKKIPHHTQSGAQCKYNSKPLQGKIALHIQNTKLKCNVNATNSKRMMNNFPYRECVLFIPFNFKNYFPFPFFMG